MGRYRILTGNIVADEILANHDLIVNPTKPHAGSTVSEVPATIKVSAL